MRTHEFSGVTGAPPNLSALRAQRIAGRVAASPALAGALADLAFGSRRRDHVALLAAATASRCAGVRP